MRLLSAVIGMVVLAWGWGMWANGAGGGSTPWVIYEQALLLSGLLSIALMSVAMVLATRPVLLERPLGGMDRIYRVHKWSGMLAVGFAALHWLIEMSDDLVKSLAGRAGRLHEIEFSGLIENLRDAGEEVGEFAIYLVLAMLVLSLWRRFPYRWWRPLHKAMPALYLLLAFHAAVLAPLGYWRQPVGWVLALLLASGTTAAFLSLSGRIGRDNRAGGVVESISTPAPDVTEVVCRLEHGWPGHRAGQFAFVSFDRFEGAHPFTIASADHGDRRLSFLIKGLGDYTRGLSRRISKGQAVTVEGPYGCFDLDRGDGNARQIWIAGGIGVTPFMAWLDRLRSDPVRAPAARLHYCTRNAAADPLIERLASMCVDLPSISLQVHDASQGEYLSAEQIISADEGNDRAEIWFCGPRGLGESLRSRLGALLGSRLRFHQEAFELR